MLASCSGIDSYTMGTGSRPSVAVYGNIGPCARKVWAVLGGRLRDEGEMR